MGTMKGNEGKMLCLWLSYSSWLRGQFCSMRSLDLEGQRLGAIEARHLSAAIKQGGLRSLVLLNLADNHIEEDGTEAVAEALGLGGTPHLSTLNMACSGMGNEGAACLMLAILTGKLPKLSFLDVSYNETEIGACFSPLFAAITSGLLASLTSLDLSGNLAGSIPVVELGAALCAAINPPRLTFVGIESCNLGGGAVGALATAAIVGRLSSLQVLDLSEGKIGGSGLEALAAATNSVSGGTGFPRLQDLRLKGAGIDGDYRRPYTCWVEAITRGGFPRLSKLDLSNPERCDVYGEDADGGNKLNGGDCIKIMRAMTANQARHREPLCLNFDHNHITDGDVPKLAEALRSAWAREHGSWAVKLYSTHLSEVSKVSLQEAARDSGVVTLEV